MARATNGPASRKRRKKVLKYAKGYFGNKSKLFRYAKEAVQHAWQYAYIARQARRRAISAVSGSCGSTPPAAMPASATAASSKASRPPTSASTARSSAIAIHDEVAFNALVKQAQDALKAKAAAAKGLSRTRREPRRLAARSSFVEGRASPRGAVLFLFSGRPRSGTARVPFLPPPPADRAPRRPSRFLLSPPHARPTFRPPGQGCHRIARPAARRSSKRPRPLCRTQRRTHRADEADGRRAQGAAAGRRQAHQRDQGPAQLCSTPPWPASRRGTGGATRARRSTPRCRHPMRARARIIRSPSCARRCAASCARWVSPSPTVPRSRRVLLLRRAQCTPADHPARDEQDTFYFPDQRRASATSRAR
jgi:large subunit ribosomal protein L20